MGGCGRRQPQSPIGPPPSRNSMTQVVSPPTLKNSVITRSVSATFGCGRHDRYRVTSGSDAMRSNSNSASSVVGARSMTRGPVSGGTSDTVLSWIDMAITFNHTIVAAKDREASARFFTELFGLPGAQEFGPFLPPELHHP